MTVYELFDYIKENKAQLIESISDLSYKPSPVRRVKIPKPDGTKRKLGVPTIVDRLVQQAVAQVMAPVFERTFSDNSFGFRSNRSAHDAIKSVTKFYDQGFHTVIDLDLKAYFDTVNHDLLMKFIKQYIDDECLLRMIRKFLTSGVMNGQLFQKSEKGTPQGGNLSPLLANIYLNELDKLLTSRGQAKKRVKQSLKLLTKRNRGRSLDVLFKEINQKMIGWLNYYGIGTMRMFIKRLDEWLRSRIRQYIWKSWKKIKTRFKNLVKLGMTRGQARTFANTRKGYWRIAHSKTLLYTLTNEKLESLGLINMSKKLQSIQNA